MRSDLEVIVGSRHCGIWRLRHQDSKSATKSQTLAYAHEIQRGRDCGEGLHYKRSWQQFHPRHIFAFLFCVPRLLRPFSEGFAQRKGSQQNILGC